MKRILCERQCKINNQGRRKLLKIRDIEIKSNSIVEHLYPLFFPCRFYDEQLVKSLGASKCNTATTRGHVTSGHLQQQSDAQ